MKRDVRIVEIEKDATLPVVKYRYVSDSYYDVSIAHGVGSWIVELGLKPFAESFEKIFEEKFFEKHVEEPRVFAVETKGKRVGWLELGYDSWNNRMRVWDISVEENWRRKGIGALLMNQAVKVAKKRGARMLVLETQSCNVPAIDFYLEFGFELIGFDAAAYSNKDVERKEVRLEFGLKL
jgi:ribosomal protein S18 acetylase RimI-like enzyme